MFVTVYNNKANEYCTDEDLYSEVELTKKIKNGEDYRVCSKLILVRFYLPYQEIQSKMVLKLQVQMAGKLKFRIKQ